VNQDRVDVVLMACRAWGDGDLARIRDLYTEDVTADGRDLSPNNPAPVHGVDAVLASFSDIMNAFDSSELIPESVIESGDTLVVPLLWRGRAEGGNVEQRIVGCYRFRDTLIAGIAWYTSLATALDAQGLPPDSRPQALRGPGEVASA
jgi:ketosteroid isomerase-like protein